MQAGTTQAGTTKAGTTKDLLFEIGVEELPVGEMVKLVEQVPPLVKKQLELSRLGHGDVRVLVSPRRLAVLVSAMEVRQPDLSDKVLGPPWRVAFDSEGKPTKAAAGFAKKMGVDVGALIKEETDKGAYVACQREETGLFAL